MHNFAKGLTITSEIILLMGIIAASLIFFLVGSNFTNFNKEQAFDFSEEGIMENLKNRLDSVTAFNGTTKVQFALPLDNYQLKGENNRIRLTTEENPIGREIVVRQKLESFYIEDEDFICIDKFEENESYIKITSGKCPDLTISKDFCANNRCVDGVCTPEYGESCLSSDCLCENNLCLPEYKTECLDEKGCILESCVGVLERQEQCEFDWECGLDNGDSLECKLSQGGEKACCKNEEIFDGNICKKGEEGDPCRRDQECRDDLECNPTHPDFPQYKNACCSTGKGWNGSECVVIKTFDLVFVPISISPSQEQQYRNQADQVYEMFLEDSPFRECSNKEILVKKYVIDPEICEGLTCQCHCSAPRLCAGTECIPKGRECLKRANLDGEKCQSGEVCLDQVYDNFAIITPTGGWDGGCAGNIPNDGSSSSLGAVSTVIHEVGHTLGLFHISGCGNPGGACQGPNQLDCQEPSKNSYYMTYCPSKTEFGPNGYYFLEHGEDEQGNKYFGGYNSLNEWMELCQK